MWCRRCQAWAFIDATARLVSTSKDVHQPRIPPTLCIEVPMSEGYGHMAGITVSGKWCPDCIDRVYGVHMCSPVDGSKAVPDFLYKFLLAASTFHQLERIHSYKKHRCKQDGENSQWIGACSLVVISSWCSCAMKRPIKFRGGLKRSWKAKTKAKNNCHVWLY